MPSINVERYAVGELGVNCYVVENTETQECILVDPGAEGERIIRQVGKRKPVAVLLTHGHFDHIGAVDEVCSHFSVPVYMHHADAPKLADPMSNVSGLFGGCVVQQSKPLCLQGGEMLTLAGMEIQVLHTPGHTSGGVCYLLPDNQGILTGDTLFAHGYGRTDFPDGDFAVLFQSLRSLLRLTPQMVTWPGHDAPGKVGKNPVEEI